MEDVTFMMNFTGSLLSVFDDINAYKEKEILLLMVTKKDEVKEVKSSKDDSAEPSERGTKTVVYPEQKNVDLAEGQYEVQVYIFRESSIRFPETIHEECIEVPRSGIGGLFGMKEENCFDIKIPSQIISNVLAGGGKQENYILESEMQSSRIIEIHAESLTIPSTLEELQNNYLVFEDKDLEVYFK